MPWREVLVFVALTYGLSWLWWAPVVLPRLGGLSLFTTLPDLSQDPALTRATTGMFGPLIATVIMRLFVTREGIKGTLGVLRPWRWYAIAVFAPMAFIALVILIDHIAGLGHFVWTREAPVVLAYPLVVILNTVVTIPLTLGEEYAWRGYLLPRLLPLGEIRATLLLAVIWATWHVPILLIGLNYPHQTVWVALSVFAISVGLLAFPFTWIYVASGGSVLVAAAMHASLNSASDGFTSARYISDGNPILTSGGGLVASGLLLLVILARLTLFASKQIAGSQDFIEPRRQGGRMDWIR